MTSTAASLLNFAREGRVLCFGEILLRLSTPEQRLLAQASSLDLHVGGAEANVAVGLARLGHATRMASVLPENDLGDLALSALASHGVDVSMIRRDAAGRMGLYFLQSGASLRPSKITYDRAGSAFADCDISEVDWLGLLDGAALLHVSGVTPALGQKCSDAALAAVRAARDASVLVSFDCNYRASLWEKWNDQPDEVLREFIGQADLLFGNHRDASLLLGRDFAGEGDERRRDAAEAMLAAYPNLAAIASTARHVCHVGSHLVSARLDTRDAAFQTDEVEVSDIIDRIGAGDAFVAGILHGLILGLDGTAIIGAGLALTCLKHSLPGDAPIFTREDLAQFGEGNLDVRR